MRPSGSSLADATVVARIPAAALADAWRSRLVENGVPIDDLVHTVAGISHYGQWCDAWCATADARVAEARAADEAGADLTAAGLWLVAALEFHFAKHVFVHDDASRVRAQGRVVDSYARAVGRLSWPGTLVDIPADGHVLRGVLRLPEPVRTRHPIVVVVPGLDATKEEVHRFSEVFLARGCATLAVDGPGQGELDGVLPIRPDWEAVGEAILDAVARRDDVDNSRVAIVGVSLGGYYAARAVSADPRWRAGASLGGCHRLGDTWDGLPPLTRNAFAARCGAARAEEVRPLADAIDLGGAELADGGGDFLVVHGCRDVLFDVEQARRMVAHFRGRAELVLEPDGDHVCHNLAYRVRGQVADWIAARLAAPVQEPR